MSRIEIGIQQALARFNGATQGVDDLSHRLNTGKKINAAKDDPVAWVKAQKSRASHLGLMALNDTLGVVASNVKIADESMDTIGKLIAQMKSRLETIVKTYPPYPPGDPERVRMLRMYMAIRKQIDDLTIPPDEGARKIMADPATVPDAGDWEFIVAENGTRITLRSREVHTGATGLNIDALGDLATDAEVTAAIASLDAATVTLGQRRAGLGGDAAGVTKAVAINEKQELINRTSSEELVTDDLSETTALLKSAELRQELALQSAKGLSDLRTELYSMIG